MPLNRNTQLDGKTVADAIYAAMAPDIARLGNRGVRPCLAAVLVGQDPASTLYVNSKKKACLAAGIDSRVIHLAEEIPQPELVKTIQGLNEDPTVHGILVQLPLPQGFTKTEVIGSIHPEKDVDGLHPVNKGKLVEGRARLIPCTPAGILRLLDFHRIPMEGRHVVVVGRSEIVGKPAALVFLNRHATVTICHSRTRDLPGVLKTAEVLVCAVGKPAFIQPGWMRPGGIIIDVGVNPVSDRNFLETLLPSGHPRWNAYERRGRLLIGDVHPAAYAEAKAFTPVPGGVGPLTVAMVVDNTVTAACLQSGIERT